VSGSKAETETDTPYWYRYQ